MLIIIFRLQLDLQASTVNLDGIPLAYGRSAEPYEAPGKDFRTWLGHALRPQNARWDLVRDGCFESVAGKYKLALKTYQLEIAK